MWGAIGKLQHRFMFEKPNKNLFQREDAIVKVNVLLKNRIETANEIRNYGSNLIFEAYDNSDYELLDSVLILNFVFDAINLLDSILVLAEEGCHLTVPYFVRGIIENSFYIEWLLKNNSTQRAEYFYTYILFEELSLTSFVNDNPEQFVKNIDAEEFGILKNLKSVSGHTEKRVKQIKSHFDKHFPEHYKRLKQNFPAKWYSVNNKISSLKDIANKIDRTKDYEIFYKGYSKSIHSSNPNGNLKITKHGGATTPIRSIGDLQNHLMNSVSYIFRIYRHIIQKYIPEEEENFNRIYIERWRKNYIK